MSSHEVRRLSGPILLVLVFGADVQQLEPRRTTKRVAVGFSVRMAASPKLIAVVYADRGGYRRLIGLDDAATLVVGGHLPSLSVVVEPIMAV